MGLIHSRAAKKRNKAEAKLLKEQAKVVRGQRPRRPTLGQVIAARIQERSQDEQ